MNKIVTVGAAALMSLSLAACGNSKSNTSSNSATSSKKVAPKYYKVGDTVKVGKVTYTLKSVEVTSERNEFADDQPKNVIKVVYHVKNNSNEELSVGTDLDAYGPDNNKLKTYPIDDTTVDTIAAGKETDVTTGFGANKLGTFELQFSPLVSTEKPVKFRVKVKAKHHKSESATDSSNASSASTKKSVANSSSRSASQANQTNKQSALQNNSSDDSSAYYSSLHQANVDYWNNLSPQEKAQWSQWESAEHWANDPARQRSFVESVNGQ